MDRVTKNLLFVILTLSLVYGLEIITYRYKRSTIGVCHALLWITHQKPRL
jgi:hypothetical protein